MQAYVITIMDNERSVQVANRCIKSAKMYDIEVEKFPAFTPKDNPALMLKEKYCNPEGFNDGYARVANVQASFLSHYALWEKCAFNNETFLIFEHDAVMVNSLPKDVDFMHVMTVGAPSYGNFKTPSHFGVGPLTQKNYFGGAHAYMVKPSGAWALMETAPKDARPTDVYLNKNNFPWLQEYFPWAAEARDNFSTVQGKRGCLAKHSYNEETYRLEDA